MEVKDLGGKFPIARIPPVDNVKPPKPSPLPQASSCEMTVQIGIFFDGTGNRLAPLSGPSAVSNIARLHYTYPDFPSLGSHRIYVPGLGTSFPSIGEDSDTRSGGAFASGGDGRIIFAMLRVIDALHWSLFNTLMFGKERIKALCKASPSKPEKEIIQQLGLLGNLVDDADGARRKKFLSVCLQDIRNRMQTAKVPKICTCFLDVFGFSRGATEARVFCHWMNDLMISSSLGGIPVRFRFLGLMDTVASVGVVEGITNRRATGGHSEWAMPDVMRILQSVENCVHFVAMHELRKSFPLDTVSIDYALPSNCLEFAYPGSHSDVGGGYAFGELGVSARDSLKLSQIPLNHMFDCAVKAGVPLSKQLLPKDYKNLFAVDEALQNAFDLFLNESTEAPRLLPDWSLPYLVWRWQVRRAYQNTEQVKKANAEDRGLLLEANAYFCISDEQIKSSPAYSRISLRPTLSFNRGDNLTSLLHLELEAPALRARIEAQPKISPALAEFFDKFVHDSVAGFRNQFVEASGHWRYRRVFRGSATPYIE
ncbi:MULTISPECIES: DUF2235 domain-containing protein [unclassified Duganella]|uniref:T6SS phospholipase effector Tle1-like catalytic domain-containing protein n=1 Tax=unclassified Duganella TaxID=2636909 RepID=UPI000888C7E2|nr:MULTISPECIES: DUF2235 domain-containing protein [unclassified Duganella]SDG29047.1 Uncharacterized alpha/beta hydrolase domain [Duganella sp. OV458]SDK71615.1 Uncharacterized alpha/beta hydrolase domain [Duganella sp. OV510]